MGALHGVPELVSTMPKITYTNFTDLAEPLTGFDNYTECLDRTMTRTVFVYKISKANKDLITKVTREALKSDTYKPIMMLKAPTKVYYRGSLPDDFTQFRLAIFYCEVLHKAIVHLHLA